MWQKKWKRATRGSMVIEGVVILPFFLLILVLFLAWMRTYTITHFLRQRLEVISLEIGTYYYGGSLVSEKLLGDIPLGDGIKEGMEDVAKELGTPFLKDKVLEGFSLDKERFKMSVQLKDEILILRGTYRLPFLLGQEVTIDEYIYRKVLVP